MSTIDKILDLLPDTQEAKRNLFKQVFFTEAGQRALQYLLLDLKFIEPCQNEGDMALNNYAKELVALVYGDKEEYGLKRLISLMFKKSKERVSNGTTD